VVGVSLLGMSTNPGPFVFASFGLFMLAFQREFGWGRGDLSLALTGLTVSCAVALPLVGRIIDRVGARRIQLVSMAIQALLLAPFARRQQDLASDGAADRARALTASANGVPTLRHLRMVHPAWTRIGVMAERARLRRTAAGPRVIDAYRRASCSPRSCVHRAAADLRWMRESPRRLEVATGRRPTRHRRQRQRSRDVSSS
jgi:hypothetical protein